MKIKCVWIRLISTLVWLYNWYGSGSVFFGVFLDHAPVFKNHHVWYASSALSERRRWSRRETTWITSVCTHCQEHQQQRQNTGLSLTEEDFFLFFSSHKEMYLPPVWCPEAVKSLFGLYIWKTLFIDIKNIQLVWSELWFRLCEESSCRTRAKQLCSSGQRATALDVLYVHGNWYEPAVTSTWMGPCVLFVIWRHLVWNAV